MNLNSIYHPRALAIMLWVIAAPLAGCVSHDSGRSSQSTESPSSVIEEITRSLEQISRDYEVAQEAGDAIAMAQAAVRRIDIARRWFHQDEVVQYMENSAVMIDLARLLASQNEETYETFLEMLAEADIGTEAERGDFSRLFGNSGNALKRKRSTTLSIKENSKRVVHLRVSDDIGVIVYVEAPALHGVRLQLADAAGVVHCDDASEYGELICRFRPSAAGIVAASITNPSASEVSVLMITNHALEGRGP